MTPRHEDSPKDKQKGPNPEAVGRVAAEHLGPLLYSLEVCAVSMEQAGRQEDADYYRKLAASLAKAGGSASEG